MLAGKIFDDGIRVGCGDDGLGSIASLRNTRLSLVKLQCGDEASCGVGFNKRAKKNG